jgi:hypothetical protein
VVEKLSQKSFRGDGSHIKRIFRKAAMHLTELFLGQKVMPCKLENMVHVLPRCKVIVEDNDTTWPLYSFDHPEVHPSSVKFVFSTNTQWKIQIQIIASLKALKIASWKGVK